MKTSPRSVSIFDLDHTLISGNSSYLFGAHLYRQRLISFPQMLSLVLAYFRHKVLHMPLLKLHEKALQTIFMGKSLVEIQKQVELLLDQSLEKSLYLPAVERLRQAQQEGQYTVILSSSPDFIVEAIAKRLGVDEWRATRYGVDQQGRFAAVSNLMEGRDKAGYIQELCLRLQISKEQITAYTDSYLDLPLLEAVGKAVGVRPDRTLRTHCETKGWEILVDK